MTDPTETPKFGDLDGTPVRFNDFEAWELAGTTWQRLHLADAHAKAKIMTGPEFARRWPHLPALPSAAFQAGDSLSKASP